MNRHRKMRMAAGKSLSELVDALKPTYPKACKAALSFAENSASTGVTLTSEADAVYKALCEPKREHRKAPVRVSGRLTERTSEEFTAAREVMGHATVNEAIVYALKTKIKEDISWTISITSSEATAAACFSGTSRTARGGR